jgi:hypothetical protein
MPPRVRAGLLLVAAWLVLAPGVVAAQSGPSLEYRVKANFLVRFAAFVTWPPSAFASGTAPMTICVAGPDPFGPALDQAAAGQSAQSRSIVVRRLRSATEAAGCHILYAAAGSGPEFRAPSAGRLLVTEAGDAGRVRFAVDLTSARRSGLTLSSRLLDLALTVRGG